MLPEPLAKSKRQSIHFGIDVVVPRIIEIGMKRIPNEACGIVVPNLDVMASDWVVELTNRSPHPTTSFQIDSGTIRALVGDREVWDDVLVWHTHPSGHVGPSEGDWEVRLGDRKNLVVALPGGQAALY